MNQKIFTNLSFYALLASAALMAVPFLANPVYGQFGSSSHNHSSSCSHGGCQHGSAGATGGSEFGRSSSSVQLVPYGPRPRNVDPRSLAVGQSGNRSAGSNRSNYGPNYRAGYQGGFGEGSGATSSYDGPGDHDHAGHNHGGSGHAGCSHGGCQHDGPGARNGGGQYGPRGPGARSNGPPQGDAGYGYRGPSAGYDRQGPPQPKRFGSPNGYRPADQPPQLDRNDTFTQRPPRFDRPTERELAESQRPSSRLLMPPTPWGQADDYDHAGHDHQH